jgi:DNA polymerase-3 subunit delta
MMLEHWEERFRKGPLPPVLLLFGEESFLVEEAYRLVRQQVEQQDPIGINVEVVDADDLTPQELAERARAYPAFAPLRGIFVRHAERLLGRAGAAQSALAQYLQQPQPTTVLVFVADAVPESVRGISRHLRNPKQHKKAEQMVRQAPGLWRTLLQDHAWVEFPKLYDREVPSWVAQRARRYGYELTPPALEALVATVGTNLADLVNELEKLAIWANTAGLKTLDAEHVLQVVGLSRTYSVFELQAALAEGAAERALHIAQYLVRSQRQELLILSLLTRYFLMLWKLADAEQMPTQTDESLAALLGVHPFFVAEYRAAYRRFGLPAIERALFALQQAEVALKTGAAPAESVISELILTITGAVTQRR